MSSDVVVVGAGPVGLTTGLLLARRGWQVDVLERQAAPYGRPRAVHLDHEAARVLQGVGVMDDLAERTEAMDAYEWRNAGGEVLLRLGRTDGQAATGCSGWPASIMFSQPDLEALLERAVEQTGGVRLHRGCAVTGLEPRPDGVAVTARTGRFEGRWIVGCDGAGSAVRPAAGLEVTDLGAGSPWVIVDVAVEDQPPWRPLNVQVCDPRRPVTAVSGGRGRRRFELMLLPGESPDRFEDPDTVWPLLAPWGLTPANARLERRATYTFGAALVDRWRLGRAVVAGDAAHQMPPFAGQGLCSGLRDAASLAWRLDLVLAGRAGDGLVDSYGAERGPQVRAEIDFSVELGRIICVLDPTEAAARDRAMVPAASEAGALDIPPAPPVTGGITRAGDAYAGALGHQGLVRHGGRTGRFDDVVGGGWVLLGSGADPGPALPSPEAAWWASLGGISAGVGDGQAVGDAEGTYGRWFAGMGAAVVLQRPDFRLFGSASGIDGAGALVADLQHALSHR